MFQQQNEPYEIEPLPAARMDRFSLLARRRYALLRENQRTDGQFSYALMIVILFQTMLMGCAILFLATLVFFNVAEFFYRSQEVDRLSTELLQITPSGPELILSPIEEPSPTATLEPTATPVPTLVLIDATPTLDPAALISPFEQPTALPFPTDTPLAPPPTQAIISPDLQAYVAQVFTPADNLATAVNTLAQLIQNPNLNDQVWFDSASFQLGVLQSSLGALEFIQPLPGAADLHNTLFNALTDCRTAASFLTEALNNRDPNQLSNATVYVQNCNTIIAQPVQQIRAYFGAAPPSP